MPQARIPRTVPVGRRRPKERERPRHRAWINTLPCLVCGREGQTECAHVRAGTDGGVGLKPSDRFCLPLCRDHHHEQHNVGELTFWSRLEIDPINMATRLWTVTGDTEAALRVLFRARQAIALHQTRPQ